MDERRMTKQKQMRQRRRKKVKKNKSLGTYKIAVCIVLIIGTIILGMKLYNLWQVHEDMKRTLQQEQNLREENARLQQRKDSLSDPKEVENQARKQFGLVKPGEIPYRK